MGLNDMPMVLSIVNIWRALPKISKLNSYFEACVIPIAIVSNIVALLIFIRPKLNQKTNTGYLYSILCVLNLVAIFLKIFFTYFNLLFNNNNNKNVLLPCFLESFLKTASLDSLTWIQVLISFDRFIIVVFHDKSKFFTKKVFIHNIMIFFNLN